MRISAMPESVAMQEMLYLKKNASLSSQVKCLLLQMDRQADLSKIGNTTMHNAEDFPNHIHFNSTDRIRRMLDII